METRRFFAELDRGYRVIAQLGEGATARVWLALARGPADFRKLVVLKSIRRELIDEPEMREMFLAEARLAARLNHPNIVQINQVLEAAGHPVLVMEYLDGVPFSAVQQRQREGRPLALAMLLRVVSDALAGLHAAHELKDYDGTDLGVVHRDANPQNLFITFAGQVKVLDFGIAHLGAASDWTDPGVIKGKLRYVSPEQASGARIDRRSDVYSMGVVLWEVATAARMWEGLRDAEVLLRTKEHAIPDPRKINPDIDAELERIISKALQKEPQDRYASALDFQNALDSYITTLGAPLHNRDIGRALSKMFEDVRQERARVIEQQLKESDQEVASFATPGLPELTSFSNSRLVPKETIFNSRLWVALWVTLFVASTAVFVLTLTWPNLSPLLSAHTSPSPPISNTNSVPTSAGVSPTSSSAALGSSDSAGLDPSAVTTPPAEAASEKASEHEPEGKGPGPSLPLGRDAKLVGPSAQTPAPAAPKTEPAIAAGERMKLEPVQPKPRPDCSPPYSYDSRGIKSYKPACLVQLEEEK